MFEYLVLLEIHDEEISSLISALRRVFTGRKSKSPVHVTVRGPYTSPIDARRLASWMKKIRNDVLLISGAGRFDSRGEHFVYLKVSATGKTANLNRITRKQDFPKSKFGFNPHITVYAGRDEKLADRVYKFLQAERFELLCRDFALGVHAIGPQYDLFPISNRAAVGFSSLEKSGVIQKGVLDRAEMTRDGWTMRTDMAEQVGRRADGRGRASIVLNRRLKVGAMATRLHRRTKRSRRAKVSK